MPRMRVQDIATMLNMSVDGVLKTLMQIIPDRNLTSQSVIEDESLKKLYLNIKGDSQAKKPPRKNNKRKSTKFIDLQDNEFKYYGFAAAYNLSIDEFSISDLKKIARRKDLSLKAIRRLKVTNNMEIIELLISNNYISADLRLETLKYALALELSVVNLGKLRRSVAIFLENSAKFSRKNYREIKSISEAITDRHNEFTASNFEFSAQKRLEVPKRNVIEQDALKLIRARGINIQSSNFSLLVIKLCQLADLQLVNNYNAFEKNLNNTGANRNVYEEFKAREISIFHRNIDITQIEELPNLTFLRMMQIRILEKQDSGIEMWQSLSEELARLHKEKTERSLSARPRIGVSNIDHHRILREQIEERLSRPWGSDIKAFRNLRIPELAKGSISNVNTNSEQLTGEDYLSRVLEYLTEIYSFDYFESRLTSRPLLTKELVLSSATENPLKNLEIWQKEYGEAFLLASSEYLPKEFTERFEEFWEFANRLSSRYLYLRRQYGIRAIGNNEKILEGIVSFIKFPEMKKEESGKFIVAVKYYKDLPSDLVRFLGMKNVKDFIESFGIKIDGKLFDTNSYYLKCFDEDNELIKFMGILCLEVLVQFMGISDYKFHRVETPLDLDELKKRKEVLEFLDAKEVVSYKVRDRKGDTYCIECGRELTDNLSRIRLFGPDCWERLHPRIRRGYKVKDLESKVSWIDRESAIDVGDWLSGILSL